MQVTRDNVKHVATVVGAVVVIVIILWVDIATAMWQEVVILSGLAAGLVTFLLTVTVLNRVLARSTAKRWAPVNRFAYSEFLHALADDTLSELSRGKVVARSLALTGGNATGRDSEVSELAHLRDQVVAERSRLADVLSRWAQFLASSGDNEVVLGHIAAIAWQLDAVRDATLECERTRSTPHAQELDAAIERVNLSFAELSAELTRRIAWQDAQ